MALNIKNDEVEALVAEMASLTGTTKTEAVRRALAASRSRIESRIAEPERIRRVHRFLEREIWSRVPDDQLGRAPSAAEQADILGFGESGV